MVRAYTRKRKYYKSISAIAFFKPQLLNSFWNLTNLSHYNLRYLMYSNQSPLKMINMESIKIIATKAAYQMSETKSNLIMCKPKNNFDFGNSLRSTFSLSLQIGRFFSCRFTKFLMSWVGLADSHSRKLQCKDISLHLSKHLLIQSMFNL